MIPVEQLAQVLRRGLGHAVDVLGNGPDVLGHPRRRRAGRRRQRPAEGAGRAREDKGADAGRGGLFQEIERARNVGIDEVLPAVRDDMRFVQGRRMEDGVHALHASLHMRAVGNRPDRAGKGGSHHVEANDFMARVLQRANQRLAEMSSTTCHQDSHVLQPLSSLPPSDVHAGHIRKDAIQSFKDTPGWERYAA